ncbi:hypothetical protein F5B20DRAFT_558523 [Whalleya microplaca]|nr:hypothetical protein F5B20DRAFT_558523 [Whalleya microplaca]
MQLATILSLVSLIATVQARCYSLKDAPGETWGSKQALAREVVDKLCSGSDSIYGSLNGTYGADGDSSQHRLKQMTFGMPYNTWQQHMAFEIWHLKSGQRYLGYEECKSGLNKEVNCDAGGRTAYENWEYRADIGPGEQY